MPPLENHISGVEEIECEEVGSGFTKHRCTLYRGMRQYSEPVEEDVVHEVAVLGDFDRDMRSHAGKKLNVLSRDESMTCRFDQSQKVGGGHPRLVCTDGSPEDLQRKLGERSSR